MLSRCSGVGVDTFNCFSWHGQHNLSSRNRGRSWGEIQSLWRNDVWCLCYVSWWDTLPLRYISDEEGGQNRIVSQYNFADQSSIKLLETLGRVTSLRYSPGGKYIAVGSEEGKTTIYEPFSGRKDKCRPGHKSEVLAIAWHKSLSFLASIGRDQTLLIYKITSNEQPQEVARY